MRNNVKAKKGGKATEKLTTTKGEREKKTSKKQDANRLGARKKLEVEIQVQGPPRLLAQKDIWSNCHAFSTMNNNDLKMATTLYSL